jgi:hypothetical protein
MVKPAQTTMVYVSLLDEGVDVWRPVSAEHIRDDVYRISGVVPAEEAWQFKPDEIVRARYQKLSGGTVLVAYDNAAI